MTDRRRLARRAFLFCALLVPATLPAQQPAPDLTRAPAPQFLPGEGGRFFAGDNWRALWARPLPLTTLDLAGFAGGLKPTEQGGGNQSVTLHFEDASGREWLFKSMNKFPERALPPDLAHTWFEKVVKDQVSALHPGGAYVVPRMMDALGLLHPTPTLYVMPDDPRLGKFRETFAGMIGLIEEVPSEGKDDTPGFAGSRKIKNTKKFLADLEESPAYRVDAREFVRARLFDMLINDTDRSTDQWRWARFGEKGNYTYRPIARDRDWAFVNGEGMVAFLVRGAFPKHTNFDADYSSIEAYTFSSYVLDRLLLTGMTRADFDAQAAEVQRRLTDDVIAAAVGDMPAPMQPQHAANLIADLKVRRDKLGELARHWYDWLFTEVDIHATDVAEIAEITRAADGSVRVQLAAKGGNSPYFDRTYLPGETNEVRVFLHGGDDHAIVRGKTGGVVVRVIGGGGDDVLEDLAGHAHFYDEKGSNEYLRARGTTVSEKSWWEPPAPEGLRFGREWSPDWGRDTGFRPHFEYNEGGGLVLGASHGIRQRGFRRLPHAWSIGGAAFVATRTGGIGGQLDYDYRLENSRFGFAMNARASRFESFRFYGLGNDTPELSDESTLILSDQARLHGGLVYRFGPLPGEHSVSNAGGVEDEEAGGSQRPFLKNSRNRPLRGEFIVGPAARWTNPRPPVEVFGMPELSARSFGEFGAMAQLQLHKTDRAAAPHRGFTVSAVGATYPLVWGASEPFSTASAVGTTYLPLLGATHLALRAGGERVWGDFPAFASAFIGGRSNLRGYLFERFAGDAAAFGNAELRIPLDTVRLVLNGELGVFGLADAGRVWNDGKSPGRWHSAFGGGVWFATMGQSLSLAYARGERGRVYFSFGLPY